jgi:hypothetical protein
MSKCNAGTCSACCCCHTPRYDIPIIDNYNISLTLYNSHVTAAQSIMGIIDCLHYCRPSLGEVRGTRVWVWLPAAQHVVPGVSVGAACCVMCWATNKVKLCRPKFASNFVANGTASKVHTHARLRREQGHSQCWLQPEQA